MGSGHEHHRSHDRRVLIFSLLLVSGFFLVELLGGLWTNSLALVSDAGHMFSDLGALFFSLMAITWAAKAPTPAKTYGYHRLEILAALINGLVLWGLTGIIFFEAYHRLWEPPVVRSGPMLIIAAIGLAVNIISALLLYPSHERSINLRSAFLHVVADGLGSVVAISASLVMLWWGWYWFDPLASLVIGLLIIASSWRLIHEATEILMEATPRHLDIQAVAQSLEKVPGVKNIHDLHIWTITSGWYALSVHVVVNGTRQKDVIRCEMAKLLSEQFNLEHTTIQIEDEATACGDFCLWQPRPTT
ncbi:MAG: cation diffusion facilitator family transporter [Desulfobacca sp.]|uniref:cation diffusion facilitator family transporter n=1 Tax=Desulfobacca sp. TaxID=2067990 RepID=UPI00404B954F